MSEPTSGVPQETTDADVEQVHGADDEPTTVDLDLDEEKLERWDEVKSDYQVEPGGKPMPNVWDAGHADDGDAGVDDADEADAAQRRRVNDVDAPEVFATEPDSPGDDGRDEQQ